ncbi:hypothetical protein AQUCO_00400053v1 [Aquilegia coerulea]|uniref:DYW domain-containing protein n=1 Tax=Aquilegia coerulea TaxID=218851 RepID=A0A2G5ET46_AQUCA|nr:hypothetical protein AQUCO_00400053v1 [Aquilegia coerulea]
MPERTLISWTILMSEYTRNGFANETLRVFQNMVECESLQPDSFVYAIVLRACSLTKDLNYGRQLHCRVVKIDGVVDSYVENALVTMYSSCGSIWDSVRAFKRIVMPDLISWSSLLRGYVQNGLEEEGLRLFVEMIRSGVRPDVTVFSIVIGAAANVECLQSGVQMHCYVIKAGLNSSLFLDDTLMNFYVKCGDLDSSMQIFRLMPKRDLVSWNTIIKGYADSHHNHETFRVFRAMMNEGFICDNFTLTSILQSATRVGALDLGREIHGYIIRAGLESDVQAYLTKRGLISDTISNNSLIKMYSGCGMVSDAVTVFKGMPERNSDSWTAVISANVDNGNPLEAIELFAELRLKNKSPDSSTLISVLKAYGQMGLVDEAFRLFNSMDGHYGIEPSIEHYSCMIEVLGRSEKFENAHSFIDGSIPFKPVPLVWKTLLSVSRIQGNMKVAKYAAEKLLELEPRNLTANLLLEQVLLTEGIWDDASKMHPKNKLVKTNSSWIEIRNIIYEFTSNQIPTQDISIKLVEMEFMMEEMGYVADRNHMLHNAEEEDYVGVGLNHTEMKALAFGLLSLPHGTPIRVIKSVRMCGDCHSAFKFMSTFLLRELLVRDTCTFHHFRNGKCSCKDRW